MNFQKFIIKKIFFLISFSGLGQICGGDAPITTEFGGELAGTIFGFTNTFACFNGFLSPIMVGFILNNVDDKFFAWNIVFYILIATCLVGGTIFLIFASAETQEWTKSKYIKKSDKESPA